MRHPLGTRDAADAALALVVTAVGLAEVWVPFESVQGDGSRALSTAAVLIAGGALTFRRRAPLPVAGVVLLGWPVLFVVSPLLVLFWGQFVPMCIALFTVARHGQDRAPFVGAGLGAALLLFLDLRVDVLQSPSEIAFHWSVFVLVWLAGWSLAVKERRAALSLQRAVDAEVTAATQVMSAVIDERTRIARELHDVVGHAVSSMVVQAGAAGQVVDSDPAYARQALESIRDTGAQALDEMRRVVAMLRDAADAGELRPQPGVASLPALVQQAGDVGLPVTLETSGTPASLPPGLDLAVYRIVQEALTNVRRHAAASMATVRLRYDPRTLVVEVTDDGDGPPRGGGTVTGHGLLGMRERVGLYGGTLHVGASPTRGFVVRAELPVPS